MNLDIRIFGLKSLVERLGQLSGELNAALLSAMTKSLFLIERRAKEKLSGEVLKVRTGRLRASIGSPMREGIKEVTQQGDTTTGTIGTRVVYGRIHEIGGTIKHPGGTAFFVREGGAIWVSNVKAERFARLFKRELPRTKAHDIIMPARPYLSPSLEEKRGEIQRIFGLEIQALIQKQAKQGGQV